MPHDLLKESKMLLMHNSSGPQSLDVRLDLPRLQLNRSAFLVAPNCKTKLQTVQVKRQAVWTEIININLQVSVVKQYFSVHLLW